MGIATTAAQPTVAELQAQLANKDREMGELRGQIAHQSRMLKQCAERTARLPRITAENERLRSYIGWVNGVLRNEEMTHRDRVVMITTRGEVEQAAQRVGVEVTEPVPVYQQAIAERSGCSVQAVGDAHRALERMGALRIEPVTVRVGPGGTPRTRNHVALTPAALESPDKLAYAPDDALKPQRGGARVPYHCPSCEGTDLQEVRTILRQRTCRECGYTWAPDPEVEAPRLLNAPDTSNDPEKEDHEKKSALLPPALNPSPARQLDVSAQTPKTGLADPRFAGRPECPWYDPARPDGSLSQGLAWACGGDVAQATLWYGSERLQDRWRRNAPIITLISSQGPLMPAGFVAWLHTTYGLRDLTKLRMVAHVLGIDASRVLDPQMLVSNETTETTESDGTV